jgi:O-antigen ligase
MRYLTSKGLRKDAEGVAALNDEDIHCIENGVANVIFKEKKFSLYPRIYQTIWEYYVYSKTGYANEQSLSQRIEFAKAAFTIINRNFWFGVGTGNWKDEFNKAYHKNSSKLSEKYYSSAHNQYLNYFVKFGFAGLILILFFIVYPVIKTKRYHDIFFLIFLVAMFFANFSDSNLESHMGGSFFVFFYCLFLITDGIDYLEIR